MDDALIVLRYHIRVDAVLEGLVHRIKSPSADVLCRDFGRVIVLRAELQRIDVIDVCRT